MNLKPLEVFVAIFLSFCSMDWIVSSNSGEYSPIARLITWVFVLVTCGYFALLAWKINQPEEVLNRRINIKQYLKEQFSRLF